MIPLLAYSRERDVEKNSTKDCVCVCVCVCVCGGVCVGVGGENVTQVIIMNCTAISYQAHVASVPGRFFSN